MATSLSDFKNCKKCNMVFDPISPGQAYCKRCTAAADKEFQKIRDAIEKHGELSPLEIQAFTDLSMTTIMSFVNEHRLGIERKPLDRKLFHVSDENAIKKQGSGGNGQGYHSR